MNRRTFVSMVAAGGAASTLVQGTTAAAQPAPTAKKTSSLCTGCWPTGHPGPR
jgi:anaerobic selenocysteine-containing dehydrogenase